MLAFPSQVKPGGAVVPNELSNLVGVVKREGTERRNKVQKEHLSRDDVVDKQDRLVLFINNQLKLCAIGWFQGNSR
jgi:hypothetical protein